MPKFKGFNHQIRDNVGNPKSNQYKVITPHDPNDIVDMGVLFQKVKVSIPTTEMIKILVQREKLLKVLTPTPPKKITFQERQEKITQIKKYGSNDLPVILQTKEHGR